MGAIAQEITPPVDTSTLKITYQGVVAIPISKAEIYNKALTWFAIIFKDSNKVIQIKDGDKIIGRFTIDPNSLIPGNVSASITILVKDNKYKFIITDFVFDGNGGKFIPWSFDSPSSNRVGITKGYQNKIKQSAYKQTEQLIVNLNDYMIAKQLNTSF
jgi:hypothetical protein